MPSKTLVGRDSSVSRDDLDLIQKQVEKHFHFRRRKYGMPVSEDLLDEAVQEVCLALLQMQGEPLTMDRIKILARLKVESVQKSSAHWYIKTMPPEAGPELPGVDSDNPLERVTQAENLYLRESEKESALQRLRGVMGSWPEQEAQQDKTIQSGVAATAKMPAQNTTESADLLRDLIQVTGWTHKETCRYLNMTPSILREALYRKGDLSVESRNRVMQAIQMQRESLQWSWPELIKDGCRATGKDPVAFGKYLADIMGVSHRSLRRWIQGESGAKRNLKLALEIRNRGWKR
ncbi:hypothetical protein HJG40_07840 [Acidithiobacillus sp. ATCC 19703]|jgi:hypothetical protein|uniref:RNA polymerase sigma-70 region 2 domain-containing protein n=1 Tax=Acidithiobacillus concretivorus TaxID=3063952 RepID=A0ABS5ZPU9_9PROT|nr:hypothetical protein [Acidithiobacillus concretivorus]